MILRPDIEQLRLAAGLAHSADGIDVRLWVRGSDPLLVSRGEGADLSPCELRWLVASAAGWIRRLGALALDGAGVVADAAGVVRVDRDGVGCWVWATTLPGRSVPLVVAETAAELLADGRADAAVVECCGAAVRVDEELGTAVVIIEEPCREISEQVGELARRLAERCRVEELLHDAERTIRNRSGGA